MLYFSLVILNSLIQHRQSSILHSENTIWSCIVFLNVSQWNSLITFLSIPNLFFVKPNLSGQDNYWKLLRNNWRNCLCELIQGETSLSTKLVKITCKSEHLLHRILRNLFAVETGLHIFSNDCILRPNSRLNRLSIKSIQFKKSISLSFVKITESWQPIAPCKNSRMVQIKQASTFATGRGHSW